MADNARPRGLVEEIAARDPELYRGATKDEQDDMRTRFAEHILREKRTDIMLIHLFNLDHFPTFLRTRGDIRPDRRCEVRFQPA